MKKKRFIYSLILFFICLNAAFASENINSLYEYRLLLTEFTTDVDEDSNALAQSLIYSLRDNLFSVRKLSVNFVNNINDFILVSREDENLIALSEQMGCNYVINGNVSIAKDTINIHFAVLDTTAKRMIFNETLSDKKNNVELILDDFVIKLAKILNIELSTEELNNIRNNQSSFNNLIQLGELIKLHYTLELTRDLSKLKKWEVYREFCYRSYALFNEQNKDPYIKFFLTYSRYVLTIEERIELLQDIIKIKPFYPEVYHCLNLEYLNKKELSKSLEYAKISYEQAPYYGKNLISLCSRLSNLEKYEEALKYAEEALRVIPKSEDALKNMILTAINLKNYKLAEKVALSAVELLPNSLLMLQNVALVYCEQNNFKKALPYYKQIIAKANNENDSLNETALYATWRLVRCYIEVGEFKNAYNIVNSMISSNNMHDYNYYYLGLIHKNLGQIELAKKYFEKEIDFFGPEEKPLLELVEYYREKSDYQSVFDTYRQIIAIDEHNSVFLNNTAWFCLLSEMNIVYANELIEKSKSFTKLESDYMGTLA